MSEGSERTITEVKKLDNASKKRKVAEMRLIDKEFQGSATPDMVEKKDMASITEKPSK